eukprot:COSAG06_NODE_392_length_16344_cov_4.086981_4_plen_76_part_00
MYSDSCSCLLGFLSLSRSGGCQNDTMFFSHGGENATDCSKTPTAAKPTCGYDGLPSVSFKGGSGQPVAPKFIPPW